MIKLYGGPRTRGTLVQWYLEELGVPYELITLNLQGGDHKKPEYLAIHPMGKVPALVEGDFTIWESGAILMYLAHQYSQPSLSVHQLAQANQWVMFANASLGPGVFIEASRDRALGDFMPPLNNHLQSHPFLLGDDFTVADVAVGSLLAYMPMMLKLDLSGYPAIANYVERLSQRPAFQNTIGKR